VKKLAFVSIGTSTSGIPVSTALKKFLKQIWPKGL